MGVELLVHMVTLVNFLGNCQSICQSGCAILYFHQQYMKVPVSLNPCQHLLLFGFFIIVIRAGIKWRIIVVSIYIFLMGNDVQHIFMCSLPITMPQLLNAVMLTLSKS